MMAADIRTRRWVWGGVGSFVGYLLLRFGVDGSIVLADSIVLTPSAGLAIPLGVLFGLPAAVGIASGALVAALFYSAFSLWSVFEGASLFVLALASSLAWGVHVAPGGRTVTGVSGWSGFVSLAAIVSTGTAAFLAWGGEFLGLFPFYVTFPDALVQYVLATALVAPPLVFVLSRLRMRTNQNSHEEKPPNTTVAPSQTIRWAFALVPVLWGGVAMAGGIGFSIRERIDRLTFQEYGFEFLYHWFHPDVFGQGGRRIQVAFGALMLVGWLLTLASVHTPTATTGNHAHGSPSDESPSTQGEELEAQ